MFLPFENLAETSKIWIYQSDRVLSTEEINLIHTQLEEFCHHWEAHGSALNAGFKVFADQFIVVAVDEDSHSATGCSIDKSVGVVKNIGEEIGVDFFNRSNIAFESPEGETIVVPMLTIKHKVAAGEIGTNWNVYNNSITQKKELSITWKQSVIAGWTSKFFKNTVSEE